LVGSVFSGHLTSTRFHSAKRCTMLCQKLKQSGFESPAKTLSIQDFLLWRVYQIGWKLHL